MIFKIINYEFRKVLLSIEGILYIMKPNNKPSILYWGKNLINFSIFCKKVESMKKTVKHLKKEINKYFNVISSQYGVVMLNV